MSEITPALTIDEVYNTLSNLIQDNLMDDFSLYFKYIYSARYKVIKNLELPSYENEGHSETFNGLVLSAKECQYPYNITTLMFRCVTINHFPNDYFDDVDKIKDKLLKDISENDAAIGLTSGLNKGFCIYVTDNYEQAMNIDKYISDKLTYVENVISLDCDQHNSIYNKNKFYIFMCESSIDNRKGVGTSSVYHHHIEFRQVTIEK